MGEALDGGLPALGIGVVLEGVGQDLPGAGDQVRVRGDGVDGELPYLPVGLVPREPEEVVHAGRAEPPVEGEEAEKGRPPLRVLRFLVARPDLLVELPGIEDPLPRVRPGKRKVMEESLEESIVGLLIEERQELPEPLGTAEEHLLQWSNVQPDRSPPPGASILRTSA